MDLVPTYIERLVAYAPGKPVEELERELGIHGAVKLASNESPLGPSPAVKEAIARAASEVHRYPDAGTYALRHDLARHHDVRPDEVCIGNGSNELIDMICRTFASPADHGVFGDPSFVCYWLGLTAANVPFTKVPLRDHLAWDVDALLGAVRPQTRVLFVANPNNPSGDHIGRAELRRLLESLPQHVVAVVDEAYFHFPDAPDYASALELRSSRERLVVLRTFSKAYGIAGLRVGYAIAPARIIDYLNRVRPPFNANLVAQQAARAALADQAHVARYVEMNRTERARLVPALEALGLTVAPSQANFVLADFGQPGTQVYERLLRMGVIIRPMPPPIETWLRITVGLPEENERLLEAIRQLRSM